MQVDHVCIPYSQRACMYDYVVTLTGDGAVPSEEKDPIRHRLFEIGAVLPKHIVGETTVETTDGGDGVGCEPKGQHVCQLYPKGVEGRVQGGVAARNILVVCNVLQATFGENVPKSHFRLKEPHMSCGSVVRREIDPVTVFGGTVSGGRRTHLSTTPATRLLAT